MFLGKPGALSFIGASPIATGGTTQFNHYTTPLGVIEHILVSDFRAEGSRNSNGIRGYGRKGMRVWDFSWYPATKLWKTAKGEPGEIRFQMHATDPDSLEPRLGTPGSKGCVRIPSDLNVFLDKYGVLDGAYDQQMDRTSRKPWAWNKDHVRTAFSGRYLVVVDSSESTTVR